MGFNLAIDRKQRGLTPPSQEPTTWASYWCQIIRSIDSPPPRDVKYPKSLILVTFITDPFVAG